MSRRGRPSKRGSEQEVEPERKRLCILHKAKVPHDAPFTFLADLGAAVTDQRLQYLHTVIDKRLKEKPRSSNQQLDICNQIPDQITPECGYHRQCYSSFTSKTIIITLLQGRLTRLRFLLLKFVVVGQLNVGLIYNYWEKAVAGV